MIKQLQGMPLVWVTISLSLAIFMNVLDISIANVSIPYMAGDLGVSPNQGTWVITSFAVCQAIFLPITGWLAMRIGEVKLFLISTLLFTIASILCGLAFNFPMLITARALQGMAAGPMIPLSQSILLAIYPENKKGFATSLWVMVAVVAPVFGPILGGWITYHYSWPWIFYINLPVGIIALFITWFWMKGVESKIINKPIDLIGLILIIIGVGALQILLDKGNDLDWFGSSTIVMLGVVSFVSLSFLILWELTEENPVIDLMLFKYRNFTIGVIAMSLGFLVYFGTIVVFPLWLQTQAGYTAVWAGLTIAPIGILSVILSPVVGKSIDKVDPRLIISVGFLVFALVSFWNGSFNTSVGFSELVLPRFVQGIGVSCFFIPLIVISTAGLAPSRMASALGLANFFRILGGSFGTSIIISMWNRREKFHHSQLVEQITSYNPISLKEIKKLQELGLNGLSSYSELDAIISKQASMLSLNDIFWLSGVIFLGLLFIVWYAKPPFINKNTSDPDGELTGHAIPE